MLIKSPLPVARALACLLVLLLGAQGDAAPARPNLILLLTDDQRADTLGAGGNALIHTPHLDRLAADGVRFRQAFVTTSICCVSRASIFTGQYERRHGITDFKTPLTPKQWAASYPALLRAAGYRTGFIGKFGVGGSAAVAAKGAEFDFWRGLPGQGAKTFLNAKGIHETARLGGEALEFLDGCAKDQPFCLSVCFTAPHARDGQPREFEPDPRDEPLYAGTSIPMPVTATDAFFQALPDFVRRSEGRRRWEKRFATPEMAQGTMRDYYALVTGIDREVGRIRARLAERGFSDNTVVIFTSDNGWFAGERGLADKWLIYEESIRVPLVIHDPRQTAGHAATTDAFALNIDLAPTLLDLAGIAAPPAMQGRSLAPFLRGETPGDWRHSFLYEHHTLPAIIPPSEGLRTERWTYLRWLAPNPESEELYHVEADPFEQRNLAADPAQAVTLATLRLEWQNAVKAAK